MKKENSKNSKKIKIKPVGVVLFFVVLALIILGIVFAALRSAGIEPFPSI